MLEKSFDIALSLQQHLLFFYRYFYFILSNKKLMTTVPCIIYTTVECTKLRNALRSLLNTVSKLCDYNRDKNFFFFLFSQTKNLQKTVQRVYDEL